MVSDIRKRVASLGTFLGRAWKQTPITALLIVVTAGLFAAKSVAGLFWNGGPRGIDEAFGAVSRLSYVPIKELDGPLSIWNGQWWRIPVSGLHHAGLLHLTCNLLGLWFLGTLLEPRMRRVSYLLFFVTSMTVSLLPEFLMEHYVVGISGALCAMFGILIVLRKRDWRLREEITENLIRVTMAILVALIPLTAFGLISIANVAHFAGLAYGWVAGQVFFGALSAWRFGRFLFFSAHLLLLPLFFAVTHPVWIGRYHLYVASRAAAVEDWDELDRELKLAVAIDPRLPDAWDILAADQATRRHDPLEAWRTALTGVKFNRSHERGVQLAQEIFAGLRTPEDRAEAIHILHDVFGDDAPEWQKRLVPTPKPPTIFPWTKGLFLEPIPKPKQGFDPDAPDSASEGQKT